MPHHRMKLFVIRDGRGRLNFASKNYKKKEYKDLDLAEGLNSEFMV